MKLSLFTPQPALASVFLLQETHRARTAWIAVGIIFAVLALVSGINYLRQRRAQAKIQTEGLVLYGIVISASKIGGWLKALSLYDIRLRIQEPAKAPREVTLRTRLPPGQRITPNLSLIVVVDPKKPETVYPATADAAKRVTLTGSRTEQKLMKAQLKNPRRFHQRTQSGYQPPINKIR